jgi:BirA family biotin operon repressor/biotin-[acetyl-CoA-carboxylase] ligase
MFTDIQFCILDTVDSTNDYAKKGHNLPDSSSLSVIISRDQTKGKGRFGKTWHAKKDCSISMSIIFQESSVKFAHQFTQILAYSACQFFQELGLNVELKWPNDLFVNGKKMGGILLEKLDDYWILGIGINCNYQANDLAHIDQKCTSYAIEMGNDLLVDEAAKVIAKIFLGHLNQLITHGFSHFHHMLNERFLLRADAIWTDEDVSMQGKIIELDSKGFLLFESLDTQHILQSGSIKIISLN